MSRRGRDNSRRTLTANGRDGVGVITLTGAAVGDRLIAAASYTTGTKPVPADDSFESVITMKGQIRQLSGDDLSALKFAFVLRGPATSIPVDESGRVDGG